jgi:hypothetical protein
MLLGSFFDDVAAKTEVADQRVELPETQRWFRCALQLAAHKQSAFPEPHRVALRILPGSSWSRSFEIARVLI